MNLSKALRCATAAASLLCVSAVAQTRFCTGGDLDHLTQTERATCSAKLRVLQSVAASLHAPENWHFVLVCGEDGWRQYTEFVQGAGAAESQQLADTNMTTRETFVRESRLALGDVAGMHALLAREIAGINTGTPTYRTGVHSTLVALPKTTPLAGS